MQRHIHGLSLFAIAGVIAFGACDTSNETALGPQDSGIASAVGTTGFPAPVTPPAIPGSPTATEVAPEAAVVCKYGTDATFDYSWVDQDDTSITGGGRVTVADGTCVQLLRADGGGAIIDVTEDLSTLPQYGQLDNVRVSVRSGVSDIGATIVTTDEPGPTVSGPARGGGANGRGVMFEFFNSIVPPPPGGEGCTPGYWRQPHHFDSWEGYLPGDNFDDVFDPDAVALKGPETGTTASLTLAEAIRLRGGEQNALIRHAVAALLNASSSGVDYDLTTADVLAKYTAAVSGGDIEGQKDEFATFNEQGCPLN